MERPINISSHYQLLIHEDRGNVVLYGKPILERNHGTQPLKTILFHVL